MSIDAVLARMKRQDESPWGRVQTLGHRCLTRIEQNRLVQAYGRLLRSRHRPSVLRSDPAIDVDVSFFVSLFLHLLLLLLISWFTVSSSALDRPGPIRVRVLDLGKSPQPQKQTVTKPKRKEKPPAKPAPKPPPPLPAPKVLARSPVKPTRLPHESAEALVRLPTRESKPVTTPVLTLETTTAEPQEEIAREPLNLPKELLEGAERPSTSGSPSALSSPDFAPYLEMIKKRVQSVWAYPDGMSGKQRVDLSFVLDQGGQLVRVEVLGSTNSELDESALQAVKRASPFPPIPQSLTELAGWPLRIRFTVDFGVKIAR